MDKKSNAVKYDDNKPKFALLPVKPLFDVVRVFTFGANKYSDRNYKQGQGLAYSRLFSALNRHIWSWWGGEEKDKETNISHLAHAVCCLLMIMDLMHSGKGIDDRDKGVKDEKK